MRTITEGQPDFKSFEREIFEIMCQIACELIRIYLEMRDLSIMGLRDAREYRYVEKRQTTVKTIMGEVTFKRVYYKKRSGGYVFLLDEALGLDSGYGLISENLAEQIVVESTDKSFRKVADSITSNTMQGISRMGVWNVVQRYGEAIALQEARLKELDDGGSTGHLGNVSSRVIFNEFDDVWVNFQSEKRRKSGDVTADAPEKANRGPDKKGKKKTGKKPIHVGIAYTGWTQEKGGRYSTTDKLAYASTGSVSVFTAAFETLLRHRFDMDGVERMVTNGDGEQWIRTEAETNDSILQLNPYHRSKSIIKAVGNKGDRQQLFDAIGEKDVEKVLDTICDLIIKMQDETSMKKLVGLYSYFSNNADILLTWQERGIELPVPPEGVTYRDLGVQEPSNCTLITQRMKHRRGSWSKKGGDHMAKILCFRNTIGLDAIMGILPEPPTSEAWIEPLSAAKSPEHDGSGYGADWLFAEMPFEQALKTNGRKALRDMVRLRPFSELPFVLAPGVDKSSLANN